MFNLQQLIYPTMAPPIRVLVCEDEMIISAKINMYLEEFGYEVVGSLTRGEQVLELCQSDVPDIILMDINLKGELDGISTAEKLNLSQSIPLIYLTANSDSATFARARATKPFAFVTKPFQKAELERALALACEHMQEKTVEQSQATELQILADRIFVRERDRMVKVMIDDILFIQAERAYCKVYTASKSRYTLSMSLGSLEAQLPPKQFIRVHRSSVVNVRHVDACLDTSVQLGDHEVPVSRGYRERLLKCLNMIS